MQKTSAICGLALLCLVGVTVNAQRADSLTETAVLFPSKLLGRIQSRIGRLNDQLTRQTQDYLRKMSRREERLRQKLAASDSTAANQLFGGTAAKYEDLATKIQSERGAPNQPLTGNYLPYLDSTLGSLAFLKQNPQVAGGGPALVQLQGAESQLQALQGKISDADVIRDYVQQRKQQIGAYLAQHAYVNALLGKSYAGMKQDIYYYSQQLRQYKEMWNNPDQLERKALTLLNRLPSFQAFMKTHSQLAGLFQLPGNYGSAASLSGLQTKDEVNQVIQSQVASGGAGGAAALQSSLQSAQLQLDTYKDKLNSLGAGNGEVDMPDFKPNDQKTRTFWKRLEFGTNFQTTRNNYMFPTVSDFGLSVGYRLGHDNIAGLGASYKLGWGNGIQHIALSSQGLGLRSFLQIKIKGSFSATGGFEYNYTTPFTSYQQLKKLQYWTQSGLLGVAKTISTKSKVFKKTSLSLLWDFLSYQAVPKTQPILFRIGYNF